MSDRQRVPFHGVIRGEGHEAECSGWCLEISLSGQPPAYAQYKIESVDKSLPDGNYMVFAHGAATMVRRVSGTWLAAH